MINRIEWDIHGSWLTLTSHQLIVWAWELHFCKEEIVFQLPSMEGSMFVGGMVSGIYHQKDWIEQVEKLISSLREMLKMGAMTKQS